MPLHNVCVCAFVFTLTDAFACITCYFWNLSFCLILPFFLYFFDRIFAKNPAVVVLLLPIFFFSSFALYFPKTTSGGG
ncbi:hypothetical protein BC829DRAFT_397147 [Chytridium lagenaria]|nr:hypothetical protein BC829DRAFT_397147 [Chytridium lagenaria]